MAMVNLGCNRLARLRYPGLAWILFAAPRAVVKKELKTVFKEKIALANQSIKGLSHHAFERSRLEMDFIFYQKARTGPGLTAT
jgi:hypothetical protein